MIQQGLAAFILAHDADRQNARAKVREVVHGIGCAARVSLRATMSQNQHRGFAGNSGDFSGNKLVKDKISDYANRLPRE
jgi:hypothetical protein